MQEGKGKDLALKYEEFIVFTARGIMILLIDEGREFLFISISHVDVHSSLKRLIEGE
jgi:hypothetical protein